MGSIRRPLVGQKAEGIVAQYLSGKGYEILDRNWRRKWGELDIVASKEGIVIFVEVKASVNAAVGFDPYLRANREKMRKVVRTARTWLLSYKYSPEQEWQVDVVSVAFNPQEGSARIQHFKNVEVA